MKKTIVLALVLVTGAVFAEFKAGFARVDATPPLGIPIVGYFHKRIADDLAFAGLPCEPFVDIGRAIKERSPFRTTVITCLTNDSVGYIASTKAHADGGYEGLSSWLAAPTGDLLVDAQVNQLTSLKKSPKNSN